MTVLQDLVELRRRISDPQAWQQGDKAKWDEAEFELVCGCVMDHLAAMRHLDGDWTQIAADDPIATALHDQIPADWLPFGKGIVLDRRLASAVALWQDEHTHAEILVLLDRAIKVAS